jgi:pseudaminic acid cytidylyltransferase
VSQVGLLFLDITTPTKKMKIAVIPARGGSKRIVNKNIREFCGYPIIYYSILQAKLSGLFDHIIVSTDNNDIAVIAKKFGAEVPFKRPKSLSGDFVGPGEVLNHTIRWLQKFNKQIDFVCCIYATAPFLLASDLQKGFEILVNSQKLFSVAVTRFEFPIQRSVKINKVGEIEAFWPDNIDKRSQDLEEAFHDAGQFYWGRPEAFLEKRTILSNNSLPLILPRVQVMDIDTEEDWRQAELMFPLMNSNSGKSS